MLENSKEALKDRIAEIAGSIGQAQGIEVVEVNLLGAGKARLLRIFIDKPEGVTHADCELMSHQVGGALDEGDIIPGESYTLEVSSPGVERKLVTPADYQRFIGKKAKIVLKEPVDDQRHWEGILSGLDGSVVTLEASAGKQVQIPLDRVKKANLKFEW